MRCELELWIWMCPRETYVCMTHTPSHRPSSLNPDLESPAYPPTSHTVASGTPPPRTLGLRDIVVLVLPLPSRSPPRDEATMMDTDEPETEDARLLLHALASAVTAAPEQHGVDALELSCHTLPSSSATPPSAGPVFFRALSLAQGLQRLDLGSDVGGALSLESVREVGECFTSQRTMPACLRACVCMVWQRTRRRTAGRLA